jgi:hypothetical protein
MNQEGNNYAVFEFGPQIVSKKARYRDEEKKK